MKKTTKRTVVRVTAFLLLVAMLCPNALAAVIEPNLPDASLYLTSYSAYVGPLGGGQIKVYFSVTGKTTMDLIGATRVVLYESSDNANWDIVANYHYSETSGMMSSGWVRYNGNTPTYYGTSGYYYKAYVSIWAGNDGQGDDRYFWTSTVQAS